MHACLSVLLLLFATAAVSGEIPGRIVFVGVDHQIYLVDPNGGEPRALTRGETGRLADGSEGILRAGFVQDPPEPPSEQRFAWPTWGPDGKSLLVQGTRITGEGVVRQAGVYRVSVDPPGAIAPLFEDVRKSPIYTFWSPTGGHAAVLVTDPGGLALGLLDVARRDLQPIAVGLPFYFAWRDDGNALVTHVGGAADGEHAEVSLIDLSLAGKGVTISVETLSSRPAAFRAPGWSPDGAQVAYAVQREEGGGAALMLRPRARRTKREVARVAGRLVFSWTPDGESLTTAEAAAPDSVLYAGINLIHLADGRREPLFAGPVAAFFWSPDGGRLLVATPEFDTGEWAWMVIERATREAREVARFRPSPELQMIVLHFDQYALSHRLWAPDSRHFVYSAYPKEGASEGQAVPPGVWMVDAKGSARRIADGRAAFWSPR